MLKKRLKYILSMLLVFPLLISMIYVVKASSVQPYSFEAYHMDGVVNMGNYGHVALRGVASYNVNKGVYTFQSFSYTTYLNKTYPTSSLSGNPTCSPAVGKTFNPATGIKVQVKLIPYIGASAQTYTGYMSLSD